MTSTVRIHYYADHVDQPQPWNEICARAIEMFGLPGDRFSTYSHPDFMDFIFENNKDALMFALEHNGEFISEQQLAVELVSGYVFK
jgi:hypothetical protein